MTFALYDLCVWNLSTPETPLKAEFIRISLNCIASPNTIDLRKWNNVLPEINASGLTEPKTTPLEPQGISYPYFEMFNHG